MVIDSSALIAILESEPEAEQLAETIEQDQVRLISAVSVVETTIVIENRRGDDGVKALNLLMDKIAIEIISVTAEHTTIACQAYRDFGKGKHSAKLNFGDCFSYAAAKLWDEPLLFKGNDFNKTDIDCCIQWVKKT
ncbi:MAG: type II toxin-antitoxin system VapC family toxin [Thiomargarita sp.]|nr:type II toxin-antitoxin system VapC family toxin [Thiomargarita sp.]